MVIEIRCPQCHKSILADDKDAGLKEQCPACGTPIETASTGRVATAGWEDASDVVYDAELVPTSTSLSSQRERQGSTKLAAAERAMKQCPICGEDILAVAVRCRYCKSPLADVAGRPGASEFLVWRQGDLLVMYKESRLPDRCVKSNQPAEGLTLKRKLSWHPQSYYLFILAGLLIYVIVALCVQKSATISIGLTREWAARRRSRILIAWMSAIGGLAAMFVGIAGAEGDSPLVWLIPTGMIACLVAMVSGIVGTRLVVPMQITDRYVWLKGVHPDYLAMLPEWPGE